ncbi:carboxypeptidase-like regulatory domain-containing protein [Psychroflexus sp. ALD_RP9]|uniref:carboxypeptidase-like regulatory domain-containing protein n=1 Tax=Psychroflexus sp. ALD_RP9 TaxID=2777186 RepID=UPI001A8E20F4|nr:carboxypeptidase-like regulatory domain-containing protein [Psychroflexus sp. ALD_RP9]QSS96730.1 carboxypeptidase-like regulatory domain-containing protein [Psychroflexus sp. ALD_RP9]
MKYLRYLLIILPLVSFSQDSLNAKLETIKGTVMNAANDKILENVNIININTVRGTVTNSNGRFNIKAHVNDTLYFSYLGFKPIQVRITQDWIDFGDVKIKMTESAIALEEVKLQDIKLTGFLEIDAKNIPIYDNYRYSISGTEYAYEGGNYQSSSISRTIDAILNPADLLYQVFGKKPKQMKRLRKMKQDNAIRDLLQDKFDRETLSAVLQISKVDIVDILKKCDYSESFVRSANDLQLLDAISDCYEEYRAVNR